MDKLNCEKSLKELNHKIDSIKAILMGNGKVGVVEMARRSFDYMLLSKKTKNGLLDWVFRGIIVIILGYVAVKIGIK